MTRSCPICGSADAVAQGAFRAKHPTFAGMKRVRCRNCAMVFGSPMPLRKALSEYNADYFSCAHGGGNRNRTAVAFHSAMARLRISHIERYRRRFNTAVSRVLEIGPGAGYFAQHWLEKNPGTRYSACETDRGCHEALLKLGIDLVDPGDLDSDSRPFDMVVLSHVLEHVPDPVQFLSRTTERLRKDGILFVEVPCNDYRHKNFDEPHLLFFDKSPMQLLLKKTGFCDIEATYHGQEIERIRSASALRNKIIVMRSKLIALGLVAPFAGSRPGMESLEDPTERAVVAPFQAHLEKDAPSWWLRALARKA